MCSLSRVIVNTTEEPGRPQPSLWHGMRDHLQAELAPLPTRLGSPARFNRGKQRSIVAAAQKACLLRGR